MTTYIAVIGAGYWGPNLIKTFDNIPDVRIKYVSDKLPGRRAAIKNDFPHIELIEDADIIISDPEIHVIIIATPVEYHYKIAKDALLSGKHVFVEKPFTSNSKEAKELLEIGKKKSLKIGVGHLFTFHTAIEYVNDYINKNNSFVPYYIIFNRANLRPPATKLNVIWDLAVHDVAVANYLFDDCPVDIKAFGYDYANKGLIDMACITLKYKDNRTAVIHVSWHTSNKIRNFQLFGLGNSIFFDDVKKHKLEIFDKGIDNRINQSKNNSETLKYKSGEIIKPKLSELQPLYNECNTFLECIKNNTHYKNDATNGYNVVKICEQIDIEIKRDVK